MFSLLCFGFSFWSLIPYITIHSCSGSGLNRNTGSNLQREGLRFPTTNYKMDHYQKQRDFINSKSFKRSKEFKIQPRFDKSSNVLPDVYSDSESIPYTNPDEEDAYTKGLINALTKNDDLLLKGSKYDIESLVTGGLNINKNSVHRNRETNDNKNKVLEKENSLINMEHNQHNIHSKEHGISNSHFNGDNTMTYNHEKGDNNMNSHDEVESTINKYLYSDDVKNDLLSDNVPLDSSIKNEVLKYIDQDKSETDETNLKMEENDHFKHYEHELKIGVDEREKNKNYNKFENEFNKDSKFENEFFFDNKHKNNRDSFEDGSKHSSLNGYSENMRYQNDFNKNFPEYHTKETNYLSHDQHQDINENENNSYEKFGETHNKVESNNELFESSQKDINADKKFTTNLSNKVLDNNFFKHSVEGELLDEYKHYPNEYLTKEESLLESEKNVNQIRDAVKLDNEGLNNELSAINEEEEKIGSIFDKKNKSQQNLNGYEYGSQTESPIHYNYETKQIQENYKKDDNEAKRFDSEEKKNDDYEEFDNETKELLNIDVRANGKIVDTNGQHATSKEEVFDQDLAVPFIQTPLNISFSSKNMSNFKNGSTLKMRSSKLEENMLLNEINNLQNELRTSNPRIITNSDAHFIVKKNFFTKKSETLNSKANQNNQEKTNKDLKVQNNQDIKAIIKKFRINKNYVALLDKSSYEPQDKTRSKRNTKIRELKTNRSSLSLKKKDIKVKNVTSINMDINKSKCQADKKHKKHVSCNPGTNYGASTYSNNDGVHFNYSLTCLTASTYSNNDGVHFNYSLERKMLTFSEARQSCLKKHGYLVSIYNQAEIKILLSFFANKLQYYWLGIDSRDGTLRWVDGKPLSYTNWKSINYNDEVINCCIVLNSGVVWFEEYCNKLHNFFCKNLFEVVSHGKFKKLFKLFQTLNDKSSYKLKNVSNKMYGSNFRQTRSSLLGQSFSPNALVAVLPYDYSKLKQAEIQNAHNISHTNAQHQNMEFIDLNVVYKLIQKYISKPHEQSTHEKTSMNKQPREKKFKLPINKDEPKYYQSVRNTEVLKHQEKMK